MVLSSYKRAEGGNIGVFLMQSGKPECYSYALILHSDCNIL